MQTVRIKRDKLIGIVRENRDQHRAVFEEAIANYRQAAIEEMDKMIAEAKAGKRIRRSLSLPEPQDQTAEYDREIRMLELSEDEIVELNAHEFAQLVLNRWTWTKQFAQSNRGYIKSIDSMAYLDSMEQV